MPSDVCCEIDELLDGLSRFAASGLPPEQFYEHLLVQGLREAEAVGCAIWVGQECLVERFSAGHAVSSLGAPRHTERLELLDRVIGRGKPESSTIEQTAANGSTCRLICVIAPIFVEQDAAGGMEFLLPFAAVPTAQDRAVHLAEAFAELIGDYYCRNQLAHFRGREVHWKSLSRFFACIHRPGLHDTAVAVANEGRWFVGCDRVSVICNETAKCKVRAVSGVDRIEPRSNLVARLKELADAVIKTGEELWEIGRPTQARHQIEQPLHNYLEESLSRALIVLPLTGRVSSPPRMRSLSPPTSMGYNPSAFWCWNGSRCRRLTKRHANGSTWSNATVQPRYQLRLPRSVYPSSPATGACQDRVAHRCTATSCDALGRRHTGVLLLALVAVPADFEIAADGELQPLVRREIFAPAAAVVDSVLVEHGDRVKTGQPLLRLRHRRARVRHRPPSRRNSNRRKTIGGNSLSPPRGQRRQTWSGSSTPATFRRRGGAERVAGQPAAAGAARRPRARRA